MALGGSCWDNEGGGVWLCVEVLRQSAKGGSGLAEQPVWRGGVVCGEAVYSWGRQRWVGEKVGGKKNS